MLVQENPLGQPGLSAEVSAVGSQLGFVAGQTFFFGSQSVPQKVSPETTLRTQRSNGPPHSASPLQAAQIGRPELQVWVMGTHCFTDAPSFPAGIESHSNPNGHPPLASQAVVQNC